MSILCKRPRDGQPCRGRPGASIPAHAVHGPRPRLGEPASDEEAAAEARTPPEERPWRGSWAPRVRCPSGGSGPEWAAGRPRGPAERGARATGPAPSEGGAQPRGLGLSQRGEHPETRMVFAVKGGKSC